MVVPLACSNTPLVWIGLVSDIVSHLLLLPEQAFVQYFEASDTGDLLGELLLDLQRSILLLKA